MVVAALTAAAALAIDAGTFLVSAVSLALMRGTKRATPGTGKQPASRAKEGVGMQEQAAQISLWSFLRSSRLIQGTTLIFIVIGLVSGRLIEVALPALVHGPCMRTLAALASSWRPGARVRSSGERWAKASTEDLPCFSRACS